MLVFSALISLAAWFLLQSFTLHVDQWSLARDMILVGTLYVQIVALGMLWIIRSIILFWKPKSGTGPWLPFDLLTLDNNTDQSHSTQKNKKNLGKRLQLMVGRAGWRSHSGYAIHFTII